MSVILPYRVVVVSPIALAWHEWPAAGDFARWYSGLTVLDQRLVDAA